MCVCVCVIQCIVVVQCLSTTADNQVETEFYFYLQCLVRILVRVLLEGFYFFPLDVLALSFFFFSYSFFSLCALFHVTVTLYT